MANESSSTDVSPVDFRDLLQNEQEHLRRQLAELGYGDQGLLTYDANFADTSQVTAERGEAEALANELQDSLEAVNQALQRIDQGTYGICEVCGQAISEARLEAMPAARRCMNDAAKP